MALDEDSWIEALNKQFTSKLNEGVIKGKTDVARNLKALGSFSLKQIAEITGLPKEEIDKL